MQTPTKWVFVLSPPRAAEKSLLLLKSCLEELLLTTALSAGLCQEKNIVQARGSFSSLWLLMFGLSIKCWGTESFDNLCDDKWGGHIFLLQEILCWYLRTHFNVGVRKPLAAGWKAVTWAERRMDEPQENHYNFCCYQLIFFLWISVKQKNCYFITFFGTWWGNHTCLA